MNTFGRKFRVSIFGESHGPGIGAVIDGVPSDMELSVEDLAGDIARRAPGLAAALAAGSASMASAMTPRHEADEPEFLSGVLDGYTTGSPISVIFRNKNTRSGDYQDFEAMPRPGHADYVAAVKWDSANDARGGGHFSGRITLPVVAAGVIAKKIVAGLCTKEDESAPVPAINASVVELGGCADKKRWPEMLEQVRSEGDSLGGVIDCIVEGLPIGLGEPFWDSVESLISHAIFSIPGVRGIEFGDGFRASAMKGSEHNDPFGPDGPLKNGSGGINGGLTNGAPLHFRVAVKPTASIAKAQRTYNYEKEQMDTLVVRGRHDACFALRTPVIVEAMTAIVLADLLLMY